jgi:hypothetical protein
LPRMPSVPNRRLDLVMRCLSLRAAPLMALSIKVPPASPYGTS